LDHKGEIMARHGKKYTDAAAKIDQDRNYEPKEAIKLAKQTSYAKFDTTVELHIRLGVDPRHADQQVRDVVVLPHGLGKSVRVLVFAQGDGAAQARAQFLRHRAGTAYKTCRGETVGRAARRRL
jgi:large subunit ribosomal protein L1